MKRHILLLLVVAMLGSPALAQNTRVKRENAADSTARARVRVDREPRDFLILSHRHLELFEGGEAVQLSVRSTGDISTEGLTWISKNPNIVSVDATGLSTPLRLGRSTIQAKAADGTLSAPCEVTVTRPNEWGNTNGNESLVIQGNWIYFSNRADEGRLYRVGIDGENLERLSMDVPGNLNATGRWLYYVNGNQTTGQGLVMVSIDGADRVQLTRNSNIRYLRVYKDGTAWYLENANEVFSLATRSRSPMRRKLFDESKPIWSVQVNNEYVFYNRNWEDIEQPWGGGGMFVHNMWHNKLENYLSVNRNTRELIQHPSRNTVYFCVYKVDLVPVETLLDIFSKSPSQPSGWFRLVLSDDEPAQQLREEALRKVATSGSSQASAADLWVERMTRVQKFPLTEEDRIHFISGAWIYYSRGNEFRKIHDDGKYDQSLFTLSPGFGNEVYPGNGQIFRWVDDQTIVRTKTDGRDELRIDVTPGRRE